MSHQIFLICVTNAKQIFQYNKLTKKCLSGYRLPKFSRRYFALPAFLAQASLQYFDLALNVVYVFLQTGHFLSIQIASYLVNTCIYNLKAFSSESVF
jgi:hypothetical protein